MKYQKKRGMKGLLASLLAATLLLSTPFALDAKKEAEVTCYGPVDLLANGEVHCMCSNEATCFDEYGCKRPGEGGFSWRDALAILGFLITLRTIL